MYVTENSPRTVLGANKQVYHQLKLALQLGLRRQVFVAVCDDLRLMYRIAARLEREQSGSQKSPDLVTLQLNLKDPSPIAQIGRWLRKHPRPKMTRTIDPLFDPSIDPSSPALPNFQFLGVDLLTRKSSASQWYFLNELQELSQSLSSLEFSLVFWLTRPWCRTIAQSVPEFWSCRTGVFDFAGEPTPTTGVGDVPEKTTQNRIIPIHSELPKSGNLNIAARQKSEREKLQPQENSPVTGLVFDRYYPQTEDNNLTLNAPNSKLYQLIGSTFLSTESNQPSNQPSNSHSNSTISESSVVEILQDIEMLYQQQPPAIIELANAYLGLGNLYRVAIGRGESNPTYIKIVIAAYEQVLDLRDRLPDNQSYLGYEISNDLGNDLGNFHWMLCQFQANVSEQISCLERAIAAYKNSLTKLNPNQQPDAWAMVQNNLGSVYNQLSRHRDPVQYLQLSIEAYQQVLHYRPNFQTIQESDCNESEKLTKIQGFATTQNNLATAYWNLAQHQESLHNLKRSISAYMQALIALESQINPINPHNPDRADQLLLNYAMIQNNLGTSYWNLSQHENAEEHLQLAISAYQIALMYRTPTVAPVACAATQNNLGTAYSYLAKHSASHSQKRHEYLPQAIVAYSTALELAEKLKQTSNKPTGNSANNPKAPIVTFDLLATHSNLGNAYYQLASESDAESDLESIRIGLNQALQHHLKASIGWQQNGQNDLTKNALSHLVQTIRAFYNLLGVQGQNLALSQIPGELLPEVMPRLSALGTRN